MFRLIKFSLMLFWPLLCSGLEMGYGASMVNFPFVGAIYYKKGSKHNNRPFCTGTIILDNYVLTTAGCMQRRLPDDQREQYHEHPEDLSVWVGSAFDFIIAETSPEAQMVEVIDVYLPTQDDLKPVLDPGGEYGKQVYYNNYTAEGFNYYLIDFSLLKTQRIQYNNYVHAVPFDPRNMVSSVDRWEWKVNQTKDHEIPLPDCFMAGWGSKGEGPDAGKLFRLRYVKVRHTEMIHCLIAYCSDCSLCHLRNFNETIYVCYSKYMGGDTCLEDEGAPIYCPWLGPKNKNDVGWGAMLGVLSGKMGHCMVPDLPGMFSLVWLAYPFITRVTRISWPPPSHQWILPAEDEVNIDYEHELI